MNHRKRCSRGAALVETAIVMPLLAGLMIAIAEFGFLIRDTLNVDQAVRAGARMEGSIGTMPGSDYYALQAIKTAMHNDLSEIANGGYVIVYQPTATGGIPAGCTTGPIAGKCNYYVASPANGDFALAISNWGQEVPPGSGNNNCVGKDSNYCPQGPRSNVFPLDPAKGYIGVDIHLTHKSVTGLMLNNQPIDKHIIVELDPDTRTYAP